MTSAPTNDSLDLAVLTARIIDDKKGSDILILHVGDIVGITEYFVIASASNVRLVGAIVDSRLGEVRETIGRGPLRSEGVREKQWVLVDYGDVVVHVFADEARRFYEIERLYKDLTPIPW